MTLNQRYALTAAALLLALGVLVFAGDVISDRLLTILRHTRRN